MHDHKQTRLRSWVEQDVGHTEVIAPQVPIIAITAKAESTLGQAANVVVSSGQLQEVCRLGLAPSSSRAVMLAIGDALALVASELRAFTHDDFALRHPGGSLGRKLAALPDARIMPSAVSSPR